MRERADELLRQAFAEVVLIPFRAHIHEGQDGDRRKIRYSCGRLEYRLVSHQLRNEAVAVPMPGRDELRLFGVVAEGFAQLLNAGGQGVIADDGVAPDRGEQLLLGHWLAGAIQEQRQHRGRLARQLELALVGPQPAGRGLEAVASEADVLAHNWGATIPGYTASTTDPRYFSFSNIALNRGCSRTQS